MLFGRMEEIENSRENKGELMAEIKPFRAIRPKKGLEARIAALPYDVYSSEEARKEVEREPYSFLKIDRAETQFAPGTDPYSEQVYQRARQTLWEMVEKGELIQEDTACYYVYELVMNGRSQTGIAACASIDDYQEQVIKKHENTRADKEADRIRHVEACEAQTGPIFLAYRRQEELAAQVSDAKQKKPVYDFTSPDGVTHRIWIIDEADRVEKIARAFAQVESVYIADGHHRCASAVRAGLNRRKNCPNYTGKEEFNYFLSVLFPDDELMILDYNRVVKDLNGLTPEQFLEQLTRKYELISKQEQACRPAQKGEISLFLGEKWYCLRIREEYQKQDPVAGLDVSLLQDEILGPVLGIKDPKTDKRIDFVGGIRGLAELERRVGTDCAAAFAMYPTSIQELFDVADAGLLMPPKSTWFEPKLRSGLLIHSIR